MDVQAHKTGTVLLVLPVHKVKIGTQPLDHVDAHLAKIGMVLFVFHVSVEDNGTPPQKLAHAPPETGTDSHAFNVLQDKDGTHQASHVHAPIVHSGMVFHV